MFLSLDRVFAEVWLHRSLNLALAGGSTDACAFDPNGAAANIYVTIALRILRLFLHRALALMIWAKIISDRLFCVPFNGGPLCHCGCCTHKDKGHI